MVGMRLKRKLKPIAITALAASCLTLGWQGKSKAATLQLLHPVDTLDQTTDQEVTIDIDSPSDVNMPVSSSITVDSSTSLLNGIDRTLTINVTDATQGGETEAVIPIEQAGFGPLQPGLTFSTPDGLESNVEVSYATFSAVDFTQDGADRLLFRVVSSDLAANNLSVTVNELTVNKLIPETASGSETNDLVFLYSEFASVDFSNVTDFSFSINQDAPVFAGDVSIDIVSTAREEEVTPEIPEPTSLVSILGVGVLGGISYRNKKDDDE